MGVGLFNLQKYDEASLKALNFIRNRMGTGKHFPVSYRNPGNPSENRSWIYDIGLALLVFTTSGDHSRCETIMTKLDAEQNTDGSFDFAYNSDTGKSISSLSRTGANGWLIWGMCYYLLVTGKNYNTSIYKTMIDKAGTWLLGLQIKTTDPSVPLWAGLLMRGNGSSGASTEHQCSALQALQGLYYWTGNSAYSTAATQVKARLNTISTPNLYIIADKRYNRGIAANDINFWALDCCTWAGSTAYKLLSNYTIASDCRATAEDNFLVTGKTIIDPTNNYSLSGFVDGFRPAKNTLGGYSGMPDLVWSEGTLGYVQLCMLLGLSTEAVKYMDEVIKLQNCTGSIGGIIHSTQAVLVGAGDDWDSNVWEAVCPSAWLYLLVNNPDVLFPSQNPLNFPNLINITVQVNNGLQNGGYWEPYLVFDVQTAGGTTIYYPNSFQKIIAVEQNGWEYFWVSINVQNRGIPLIWNGGTVQVTANGQSFGYEPFGDMPGTFQKLYNGTSVPWGKINSLVIIV